MVWERASFLQPIKHSSRQTGQKIWLELKILFCKAVNNLCAETSHVCFTFFLPCSILLYNRTVTSVMLLLGVAGRVPNDMVGGRGVKKTLLDVGYKCAF